MQLSFHNIFLFTFVFDLLTFYLKVKKKCLGKAIRVRSPWVSVLMFVCLCCWRCVCVVFPHSLAPKSRFNRQAINQLLAFLLLCSNPQELLFTLTPSCSLLFTQDRLTFACLMSLYLSCQPCTHPCPLFLPSNSLPSPFSPQPLPSIISSSLHLHSLVSYNKFYNFTYSECMSCTWVHLTTTPHRRHYVPLEVYKHP